MRRQGTSALLAGAAPPDTQNPDDVGRPPCLLESCSWWSALSFMWLNPIIKLGSKRVLQEYDLPALARAERANRLQDLVLVRACVGMHPIGSSRRY